MLAIRILKRLIARFIRVLIYHPVSSTLVSVLLAALIFTNLAAIRHSLSGLGSAERALQSRLPFASQAPPSLPSGSPEAAVQLVVARADFEQELAIRSHQPSVMKDTSTAPYYQEVSQTNQELLDSGVTSIKLVRLKWGTITVSGNTATATTYETWLTDYADGRSEQSTAEENVYRLIRESGTWKIQADQHPNDRPVTVPPSGSPAGKPAQLTSPGLSTGGRSIP